MKADIGAYGFECIWGVGGTLTSGWALPYIKMRFASHPRNTTHRVSPKSQIARSWTLVLFGRLIRSLDTGH